MYYLFVMGYFLGVYHYFYFWQENLMSHVTYDIEGTQDAISDPLLIHTHAESS